MIIEQRHPWWLVVLLALVLLGQSLAAVAVTVPCVSMVDAASMSHDMKSTHQTMMGMHHDMDSMDAKDPASVHDCCKAIGHCPASSCSAPALGYSFSVAIPAQAGPIPGSSSQSLPSSPVSSPYRPPIFR